MESVSRTFAWPKKTRLFLLVKEPDSDSEDVVMSTVYILLNVPGLVYFSSRSGIRQSFYPKPDPKLLNNKIKKN